MEHSGWIDRLQRRLAEDDDFAAAVDADHERYVADRWSLLSEPDQARIRNAGLEPHFRERGIGGIRNRRSVKCLHLHFAHHLAAGSTIGAVLEQAGKAPPCPRPPA